MRGNIMDDVQGVRVGGMTLSFSFWQPELSNNRCKV